MMQAARRTMVLAGFAILGVAGTSGAQEIQFQGITTGCFFSSAQTSCAPTGSSDLFFLNYTGSTFNVASDPSGEAFIGAAAAPTNVNNLGSFTLGSTPASYAGSTFLLNVAFTLPTITSSPSLFTAAVRGSVTAIAGGGVRINFDPASQIFDFQSGESAGQFTLNVNNVSFTPGMSPVALTGDIQVSNVTATPEPATTAMLATGLLGLVPVVASRRKKSLA